MDGTGTDATETLRFRVQKHAARRLHYDLRLELDGVLLSWALTRGPSLDPARSRLAVRTCDHALGYADFEGTIAAGFGAGTVMLWDIGTWAPEENPRAGLAAGRLRFTLRGRRMRGGWTLARMRTEQRERWLLRKRADEEAGAEDALTDAHRTSIATGRTMEEIAGAEPASSTGRFPRN
ncbi:DNA polymerase ligase N-terminal domain-containing protein [Methylobacterium amylolyticum]|uniref:DNA polymerase ligase N-terminal domain-containing protein n=1 Tax=Methylobacterium sp. NEAU 140 TaxID=3064945 RepID=UPI003521072B